MWVCVWQRCSAEIEGNFHVFPTCHLTAFTNEAEFDPKNSPLQSLLTVASISATTGKSILQLGRGQPSRAITLVATSVMALGTCMTLEIRVTVVEK